MARCAAVGDIVVEPGINHVLCALLSFVCNREEPLFLKKNAMYFCYMKTLWDNVFLVNPAGTNVLNLLHSIIFWAAILCTYTRRTKREQRKIFDVGTLKGKEYIA